MKVTFFPFGLETKPKRIDSDGIRFETEQFVGIRFETGEGWGINSNVPQEPIFPPKMAGSGTVVSSSLLACGLDDRSMQTV